MWLFLLTASRFFYWDIYLLGTFCLSLVESLSPSGCYLQEWPQPIVCLSSVSSFTHSYLLSSPASSNPTIQLCTVCLLCLSSLHYYKPSHHHLLTFQFFISTEYLTCTLLLCCSLKNIYKIGNWATTNYPWNTYYSFIFFNLKNIFVTTESLTNKVKISTNSGQSSSFRSALFKNVHTCEGNNKWRHQIRLFHEPNESTVTVVQFSHCSSRVTLSVSPVRTLTQCDTAAHLTAARVSVLEGAFQRVSAAQQRLVVVRSFCKQQSSNLRWVCPKLAKMRPNISL